MSFLICRAILFQFKLGNPKRQFLDICRQVDTSLDFLASILGPTSLFLVLKVELSAKFYFTVFWSQIISFV